jgi:6-phosphogluconolactonase/glucosamine-6-phosphate isomerase/deaminase
METLTAKSEKEWAELADAWIQNRVLLKKAESIFLPAGNTPLPLYALWREHSHPLPPLQFYQIDEVGNTFETFFRKELPHLVPRFHWVKDDPTSTASQPKIGILGIGLNGHVAFHEPGLDPQFRFGSVLLSDKTCETLDIPKGSHGTTYGIQAFKACDSLLILVRGKSKSEVVHRFKKGDLTLPITQLADHKDICLLEFDI